MQLGIDMAGIILPPPPLVACHRCSGLAVNEAWLTCHMQVSSLHLCGPSAAICNLPWLLSSWYLVSEMCINEMHQRMTTLMVRGAVIHGVSYILCMKGKSRRMG